MPTQEPVRLRLVESSGYGLTPELLGERVADVLAQAEATVAAAAEACERARAAVTESRSKRVG